MEHMKFEAPDLTAGNVEKIAALFPNCVTEMLDEEHSTADKKVYKKAVNFDMLRQMLSGEVVEGDEAYEFTWVGKKASIVEANRPIRKTLRPCPEESVNWDSTENLYIEGDNLEVLKLLQESYLGKVKVIYIDPPYNTGSDFIYRDDFKVDADEYDEQLGMYDEEENKLFKNTDSNGKFHSDWCSMMYPRLLLARNLLAPDGAIFISIDDHEAENLKEMCDEAFGADCFVANISWQRTYSARNDSKGIVSEVEHLLVFSKFPSWNPNKLPRTAEMDERYSTPDNDDRPWKAGDASAPGASTHPGMVYAIQHPITGELLYPPNGRHWTYGQDQMFAIMSEWAEYELKSLDDLEKRISICGRSDGVPQKIDAIVLTKPIDVIKEKTLERYTHGKWPILYFTSNGTGGIACKRYLDEMGGRIVTNLWQYSEVGHTDEAKKEIMALFDGNAPFDTPKPVRLMDRILTIASDENSTVLDFFSGSASMAHAIMQKNANDGGHRKFIMVQIPEKTSSPDYPTLCEIGKERIRRAGAKIKADNPLTTQDLDIGFRVFKVDDTNMEDVYYSPVEYTQEMIGGMVSNIKPDRSDLDLLFGCLLDWGLPLSLPYHSETIDGCTVHTYAPGDVELDVRDALIACFDNNVPERVIKEIAGRKPLRAVFRDSSFASSPEKINVEEIFAMLAPDTKMRVI